MPRSPDFGTVISNLTQIGSGSIIRLAVPFDISLSPQKIELLGPVRARSWELLGRCGRILQPDFYGEVHEVLATTPGTPHGFGRTCATVTLKNQDEIETGEGSPLLKEFIMQQICSLRNITRIFRIEGSNNARFADQDRVSFSITAQTIILNPELERISIHEIPVNSRVLISGRLHRMRYAWGTMDKTEWVIEARRLTILSDEPAGSEFIDLTVGFAED
ncbi:hypothetical protein PQX77_015706 [Marasmius sp. AFHP31]|nr:hypothetical protein PQX77_015706 [Marasmius sp. AFHP31]